MLFVRNFNYWIYRVYFQLVVNKFISYKASPSLICSQLIYVSYRRGLRRTVFFFCSASAIMLARLLVPFRKTNPFIFFAKLCSYYFFSRFTQFISSLSNSNYARTKNKKIRLVETTGITYRCWNFHWFSGTNDKKQKARVANKNLV